MASFTLQTEKWYGWQMSPGYDAGTSIPYFSPIFVHEATPLKTGKGILRLEFWNAGYASGVQDFRVELKVIHRSRSHLVGQILDLGTDEPDRTCTITPISKPWLQQLCPWALESDLRPAGDMAQATLRSILDARHNAEVDYTSLP